MSAESVRSKKRVTRMVVVVVAVFAFCWFPIQTVLVLKSFSAYKIDTFKLIVQIGSHILGESGVKAHFKRQTRLLPFNIESFIRVLFTAYMNSCVNPIL